jgi:cell wall-associated NlpC family hydrolase
MAKIPGLPIGFMIVGGVLVYSGIENRPVGYLLRDLARGIKPTPGPGETFATPAAASSGSGGGGSASTDSAIANDALGYTGHVYVYGGPSNVNGGWDCSSFVSWVLGHDLNMDIPGGTWAAVTSSGRSHGPIVAQYVVWGGATGVSKADVQAGDLILYPPDTHMGIAVSATEFISAEQPSTGTGVAPMSDGPGPWIARRCTAAAASGGAPPTPGGTQNVLGEL